MVGRKRKRSSTTQFKGNKRRRLIRRPLAPRATRGFYGRNQMQAGAELKDIESSGTQYECSTTGAINLINGVAQGTDFTNRDGRRFNIKSVLLRGQVQVGATATSAAWRLLLIWDKQANGAAPVIGDILSVIAMYGVQNLSNRDRFIVLMDKTGMVEKDQKTIVPFKKYMRCQLVTTNSGTANTIGSIATGAMYLVSVGNLGTGVTAPVATITSRVRFTDP